MVQAVERAIAQLRSLVQLDVQRGWRVYEGDWESLPENIEDLPLFPPNEKGFLVWEAGRKPRGLVQRFVIPSALQQYPLQGLCLRLALTWWAETAQIFVNGELVQAGDLFDSSARVLLCPQIAPEDEFTVVLQLTSPGHDIGALMRSQLLFEATNPQEIDPGFVADELAVLQKYWQQFEPQKLEILETSVEEIAWDKVEDATVFHNSLSQLRDTLKPQATSIKQRRVQMLGHAHLDMAWLWEVSETWDVAQRTFASVLSLRRDFPDFTFCHTSPVLYEWLEKHRPEVFAEILAAVKGGWWDVVGGMWVEPDVNLPNGESLVRQLLYGQQYNQEKFGKIATVGWLTDSFGFNWQLPQLLKLGGIEYFVTQKLHWNDTTEFPFGAFWWQSPDGTQIFTVMSPPNVTGVMDTNPMTISDYTVKWEAQTGLQESFWLPGVGDHGGGPSRDMLEVQQRWQLSPFFPQVEFTTSHSFLQGIQQQGEFPVWEDELYLELHRGCYTAHADQKLYNRRCEILLYQAQLWSAIAFSLQPNPNSQRQTQQELEKSWKKVLFNQFHDILPGTSIPGVFVTANRDWQDAENSATTVFNQALETISQLVQLPTPPHADAVPIVVFNSLNWTRSQILILDNPFPTPAQIITATGESLTTQVSQDNKLLFLAEDIPSIGYCLFWITPLSSHNSPANREFGVNSINFTVIPAKSPADSPTEISETDKTSKPFSREIEVGSQGNYTLENQNLKATIDAKTGEISSLFNKTASKQVLSAPGNQLQAFNDKGQYWDAWNIAPDYEQNPLPLAQLVSISWQERGKLRQSIRVVRQIGKSTFTQDYILDDDSPLLHIATTVDWQEKYVMVKAAFPLTVNAPQATYEIPCGAIQRPTNPQTPAEKAKWEVCALQWADLSDAEYGVSLLNDCKYGYDCKPNQIRLTLLRSPQWPHPECDRALHHFTYTIYPHTGSWQEAQTVRKAYELNQPLQSQILSQTPEDASLPPQNSFLELQGETAVLMTLKPAETNHETLILRCYESCGEAANLSLGGDLGLKLGQSLDGLERPLEGKDGHHLSPWQIATFRLQK
ncbi:MAG: alpha-mannosidase [Jaaginema sp. PMC 1079.18]|nr:alpha-mannosidase [Jaaginema sp. PMC 1080.18]MEC4851783.1 alpha-mannosidase [Jaaginema sp. PMC 1079.18]MEC4866723.1 alpha-mannosidase [Jaaginema sp. PMC 1078.18]